MQVPQPKQDSESALHSGALKNSAVFPEPNFSAEREERGSLSSLFFVSSCCAVTAAASDSSVTSARASNTALPFSQVLFPMHAVRSAVAIWSNFCRPFSGLFLFSELKALYIEAHS